MLGIGSASLPFKGGTLLVDIGGPNFPLASSTDTQGDALVPMPIPNDSGLLGLSVYCQWLIQDAGAPADWSMSGGLELGIGS